MPEAHALDGSVTTHNMAKKSKEHVSHIAKSLRSSIIFFAPVILVLLTQAQHGQFDLKVVYAGIISILMDYVRRVVREDSGTNP